MEVVPLNCLFLLKAVLPVRVQGLGEWQSNPAVYLFFFVVAWMDLFTWPSRAVACPWSLKASALPAKGAMCLLLSFPVLLTGHILQAEVPQSRASRSCPSEHMENIDIKEDLLRAFAKHICSYKITSLFSSLPSLAYHILVWWDAVEHYCQFSN